MINPPTEWEIRQLRAEVERLREALVFYAWNVEHYDQGERALRALYADDALSEKQPPPASG